MFFIAVLVLIAVSFTMYVPTPALAANKQLAVLINK